jgi:23S rRNA U2552 (ribose-2'-O)-methylase RlmE/FtsJ
MSNIYEFTIYTTTDSLDKMCTENNNLKHTLFEKKNEIDSTTRWDVAKKYANEFEFVFSFNYECIANKTPISRSYFKLIEIIEDNNLLSDFLTLNCACLCEGPGGFIQAIHDYTEKNTIFLNSPINCITLLSENKKIPKWKLSEIPRNVYKICYGKDGTGNLYNIKNIEYFISSCNFKKQFITADGGFDFSEDFNSQEEHFLMLLLCEIYVALNIQTENGHFVVKCFDLFHKNTIQIISFLRMFYKTILIQKPKTSRPANSEKYIICKSFECLTPAKLTLLQSLHVKISNHMCDLSDIIPEELFAQTLMNVLNFNRFIVHKQILYIDKTIEYSKKITYNKQEHIEICKKWCKSYKIPMKATYL